MEQLNRIELRGVVGNVKVQNHGGNNVARIVMATDYVYKDRQGAAVIETSWHNITAWEGKAIQGLEKIEKGSKLYVTGRVRYQKYTASDGVDRMSTDIIANRLVLLDDPEPLSYEQ